LISSICRRVGVCAPEPGHHRHRAGIFPDAFARQHAAVGQSHGQRHLDQIERAHALHIEATAGDDVHHFPVARGEDHRSRQSRGAAARLQDQRQRRMFVRIDADIVRPWRIARYARTQVVHGERRNLGEIIEAADVPGLHSRRRPVPAIERDLPGPRHLPQKPLLLQRAQFIARQAIGAAEVVRGRRKFAPQRFEIERLVVARNCRLNCALVHAGLATVRRS
jgi:hypothetical protein